MLLPVAGIGQERNQMVSVALCFDHKTDQVKLLLNDTKVIEVTDDKSLLQKIVFTVCLTVMALLARA